LRRPITTINVKNKTLKYKKYIFKRMSMFIPSMEREKYAYFLLSAKGYRGIWQPGEARMQAGILRVLAGYGRVGAKPVA
jgi:hypothetical protein